MVKVIALSPSQPTVSVGCQASASFYWIGRTSPNWTLVLLGKGNIGTKAPGWGARRAPLPDMSPCIDPDSARCPKG